MTEGLVRRRGAGHSDSVDLSSGSAQSPRKAAPLSEGNNTTGSSTGSGAMEGRGKVAYDKRDFENKKEEGSEPKLTIMEEVLLLGLKDKAVSL